MIVYIHSCTHKEAQYKSVSSEEEKIMKRKNMAAILGIVAAAAFSVTACGTGSAAETASSTASAGQSTAEESSADTTESTENSTQQGPGDGEAPEKPSGEAPDGQGGPGGDGQAPDGAPGGQGGPGGADTQSYDYQGETSGTKEADGEEVSSDSESISSTEADVNAALVKNAGTLTITNGTLTKSGDDTNGDNCNFYGINSILLSVGEGSKAIVSDSSLTSDSEGSNAMFATDSGEILAYNDTIHTTADNARGLYATYGGTILADSCDITTEGDHCASIATDRGGGSISATNGTLSTAGSGSPLLYSTGDIEVDNVTGTATGSQIAGMEGLNTILIYNSDLTSTITKATASDPVANGVIIYQSTSGDAETTTGERAKFEAVNSKLTSSIEEGSFFYVTNTNADILLSNTELSFDADKANLLTIEGNDSNNWGTAGSNGGTVTFTARNETLKGGVSVDTISSLDLYLLDGTTYTGAMEITENSVNTDEADAPITVNISGDSTWVVTEDTTISALNAEDGASIVDEDGGTVTIVADGKTVVNGTSDLTVTVTGSYGTTVTTSDANEISTDYIDRTDFDSYFGTTKPQV